MKESALVHSNMIIDYDLSLWYLLKNEYNGDYINKNLLECTDDQIRMILNDRTMLNPLHVMLNDTISDSNKDALYNSFMTTKKNDILKYVQLYNNIIFVLRRLQQSSYTDVTIAYADECEKEFLNNLIFNTCHIDNVDFDKYNAIFTKTCDDIVNRISQYFGLNIYLAMTGYNCKYDSIGNIIFDKEFAKIVFKKVNINIIALYVFDEKDIILG